MEDSYLKIEGMKDPCLKIEGNWLEFRKAESSKEVIRLLVDNGGREAPLKGKFFVEVVSRGKKVLGKKVWV